MAQHFVLDLHQAVGIEEVAVLKQTIGDGFRMWVQSAVTAKRPAFGLGIGWWRQVAVNIIMCSAQIVRINRS